MRPRNQSRTGPPPPRRLQPGEHPLCDSSREKFGLEITVVRPPFWEEGSEAYALWFDAMEKAEACYMALLEKGARPEEARSVLPSSLKTEVIMTCNLREWRHVLDQRCSRAAHGQMREIMLPLLRDLRERIPVVLDDVYERHLGAAEQPCLAERTFRPDLSGPFKELISSDRGPRPAQESIETELRIISRILEHMGEQTTRPPPAQDPGRTFACPSRNVHMHVYT